jgi:glycosidase
MTIIVFRNVEAQRADPNSLFHFYRRLLALRKQYPVLVDGMFQPLTFEPRSLLAYLRQNADQTILVALNFSRRSLPLVLGSEMMRANWDLLLSNKRDITRRQPGIVSPVGTE